MSLNRSTRLTVFLAAALLIPAANGLAAPAAGPKPVSVFPSPGTPVASNTTTFSFRGLKPGNLGPVRVVGSSSGRHGGRRLVHSDGNGVSFVPRRAFSPGETVSVFTRKAIKLARGGDFRVRIGRSLGRGGIQPVSRVPNRFPRLHSKPGLRPPSLDVLTSTEESVPGQILFAPKQTGLTIADRSGRITWFRPTVFDGGSEVQDFNVQTYRGKRVLTYWKARSQAGNDQKGSFNILNRNYTRIARFGMGNGYRPDAHEFVISPRSTALALAYRVVRRDLRKFGGPRNGRVLDNVVQEIDIRTGAVLFEWHSIGKVGLEASISRPDGRTPWDYFHVNSVEDDGDSFLVSARKVNTVYRISKRTGRIRWRLRGDGVESRNDFEMGPGTSFGYQHDARRLPNGDISLFDNGVAKSFPNIQDESSALVLRLRGDSAETRRAGLVKRFVHRPSPVMSGSQGSAQVLAGGGAFVGWGSMPRLTEFTPDGDIAFDATFEQAPVNSYRARKVVWNGVPNGRPALASRRKGEGMTVWASWNGAGNIDHWRVLAGPGAKRLKLVRTAPWRGLETAIPVSQRRAVIRVQAISASGKVLGQSAVAPLGKRAG